jgi:ribosomal protein L11 methyltransferase
MKYLCIDFHVACQPEQLQTARDLLADAAAEAGLESFEDSTDGLLGYVQKELFNRTILDKAITDLMPGVTVTYTVNPLEDKDWNKAWEEAGFEPIDIEGRVVVYDARKEPPATHGAIAIGIEPVQSFGSGTHDTTQMVIATLLKLDLKDKRVLDCGCGTGILAIVAAKLGAADVVAYDVDDWCVENTKHNAQVNHVENISVLQGNANVLSHVSGLFSVVMANINRNVLLNDLPAYKDVMVRGGQIILSGFYESDIPVLLECAEEQGLHEVGRMKRGDWCCLLLQL